MPGVNIRPKSFLKILKDFFNNPKKPLDEKSKNIFKRIISEKDPKLILDLLNYMPPKARKFAFASLLFGGIGGGSYKIGVTKPIFPEVISGTPRNEKHYKDRKARKELEKMIEVQNDPVKMVAITGISGSGKTELAKKYYNDLQNDIKDLSYLNMFHPKYWKYFVYIFNNVGRKQIFFQFDATNEERLLEDYENLICRLDNQFKRDNAHTNDQHAKRIKDLFNHYLNNSNFFFIYDNARHTTHVNNYIPTTFGQKGTVIITSVEENFLPKSGQDKLNFSINNGLEIDEAVELLCELSGDKNPTSQKDAEELVIVLGKLPLAISTAGIYISSHKNNRGKKINFSDYNQLLKNSDSSFILAESDYRKGLLYEKTQNESIYLLLKETGKPLFDVVKFCALIHENIPKDLLDAYYSNSNILNNNLPNFLACQSLITASDNEYYINNVTQIQAKRLLIEGSDGVAFLIKAGNFLTDFFKKNEKNLKIHLGMKLHFQCFLNNFSLVSQTNFDLKSIIPDVRYCLGQIYSFHDDSEALNCFLTANTEYKTLNNDFGVLKTEYARANILFYQLEAFEQNDSQHNEKFKNICDEVIIICKSALRKIGSEHIKEINNKKKEQMEAVIYDRLGCVYLYLKDYSNAKNYLDLAVGKKQNSDELSLATSLANRSRLLKNMGNQVGACTDATLALKKRLNGFSSLQHSDVPNSLELSGDLCSENNEMECAVRCYSESQFLYKSLLGNTHPYFLRVDKKLKNLGGSEITSSSISRNELECDKCFNAAMPVRSSNDYFLPENSVKMGVLENGVPTIKDKRETPILYWFTRIAGAAVGCIGLYKMYSRPR